jgi:hypothetical protein
MSFTTNKACVLARGGFGNPPKTDTPQKRFCPIYERDEGESKPVAYEGASCEYYEAAE